jgi:hypothetical protein
MTPLLAKIILLLTIKPRPPSLPEFPAIPPAPPAPPLPMIEQDEQLLNVRVLPAGNETFIFKAGSEGLAEFDPKFPLLLITTDQPPFQPLALNHDSSITTLLPPSAVVVKIKPDEVPFKGIAEGQPVLQETVKLEAANVPASVALALTKTEHLLPAAKAKPLQPEYGTDCGLVLLFDQISKFVGFESAADIVADGIPPSFEN